MVASPWRVLSPDGTLYIVDGDDALKELAAANGMINSQRKNKLKEVVGAGSTKDVDALPLHRHGWQLLERVQWLVHVESGKKVPIVGGDGQKFISNFKEWCDANLPKLDGGGHEAAADA